MYFQLPENITCNYCLVKQFYEKEFSIRDEVPTIKKKIGFIWKIFIWVSVCVTVVQLSSVSQKNFIKLRKTIIADI
jgi:hypothetical protein